MAETSESLVIEDMLLNPVKVVDHGHATPADAKRGMHVGLGPVEDLF